IRVRRSARELRFPVPNPIVKARYTPIRLGKKVEMVGHQNVSSNRPGGRLEPNVSEQLMRLVVSQPAAPKSRTNRQEHNPRDFIRIQNVLSGSFPFMKRDSSNMYFNCYSSETRLAGRLALPIMCRGNVTRRSDPTAVPLQRYEDYFFQ